MKRNRILAGALVAMLISSCALLSTNQMKVKGESITVLPSGAIMPKEGAKKPAQTSRYARASSSMETSYSNVKRLPALRDQSPYGTCWAFATIGAMEADLIANGQADTSIDLSELALAYFTYHNYDDPKKLHNDDTVTSPTSYLNHGGNYEYAASTLSNNAGVVTEENVPYDMALDDASAVVADEYALGHKAAYLKAYQEIPLATDADGVKTAIKEHGAVAAQIYWSTDYYNESGNAFYNSEMSATNHGVMLVGWDDNFAKENFNEGSRPGSDGAWLVRNSWWPEEYEIAGYDPYNEYGYFWVSYEDLGLLAGANACVFDAEPGGYDNCYSYAGLAYYYSPFSGSVSGCEVKEQYPVDAGEQIGAIGVFLNSSDVTVDIKVTAGDQSVKDSYTTTYTGFYVMDFEKPLVVTKDTDVTVSMTMKTASGGIYLPYERTGEVADNDVTFHGVRSGNSTISGWAESGDLCVKLYTDDVQLSSISLAPQSKTYNGKAQGYTGKVIRSGSTGKVTYSYYLDAACTKPVKAANVKNAGTYYVKATLAADENYAKATGEAIKFTIKKADNTIKVKAVKKKISYKKVKKKSCKLSRPVTVKSAKGKVTYSKSSGSSRLKVAKKTGKVTVKKGTSSGTYTIKIKVKAAGNSNYKAASKIVKCKVIVK
ncbi:MAG: hypothetical protein K6G01_11215 [Eubacterium sp.]|nr:hypothetical protein [Eubacterium sp.]